MQADTTAESRELTQLVWNQLQALRQDARELAELSKPGMDVYAESIRQTTTLAGGALVASVAVAELTVGSAQTVEASWLLRVAWICWGFCILTDLFRWRVLPTINNLESKVLAQVHTVVEELLAIPDSSVRHSHVEEVSRRVVTGEIQAALARLKYSGMTAVLLLAAGMFALALFAHYNIP